MFQKSRSPMSESTKYLIVFLALSSIEVKASPAKYWVSLSASFTTLAYMLPTSRLILGYGMWAVEEQSSCKLIGRIGFIHSEGWPRFELGWLLARPYQGKGYATEGAKYALEYAFTELEKEHVISLISPENKPSIKVAMCLGEKLERETILYGNRVLIYRIDRDASHIV